MLGRIGNRRMSKSAVLVKQAIWKSLGYEPHSGQKLMHGSPARHRVAACGRRFGKSVVGGNELVPEAMRTYTMLPELQDKGTRREFWIVGPEYTDAEKEFRVFWNAINKLQMPLDHPGTYNNPEAGQMSVSMFNGKFKVFAKSAKYPATLVGESLSGVILAEAAKLKSVVWSKYIRPTLADTRGWSIHTSTPEGKNWFYDAWKRGQDPAFGDWDSWRMPSWVNDIIFPLGKQDPEIRDMAGDITEELFNQEIGAMFTEFVGRVFGRFEEETHVFDLQYNPELPCYIATDYGWTNPMVCLVIQVDVWDNVYIIGEKRFTKTDILDISRELPTWRGGLAMRATRLYPDPEAPGDSSIVAKALGLEIIKNTGGELKWRLELIRQALKVGPEHAPESEQMPKLFVDRSCKELIREMQDYRYPETDAERAGEAKENPLKKDDHGPEALGRFFRGYFGGPVKQGRSAKVSTAKVSR